MLVPMFHFVKRKLRINDSTIRQIDNPVIWHPLSDIERYFTNKCLLFRDIIYLCTSILKL